MPDNLPNLIMLALSALLWLLVTVRLMKHAFAPVRTVQAEVVDKHKTKLAYSKTGAYGNKERYCVVFLSEGKKLSFYVSAFSYGGYRIGEKGKLTYKGNRLIDFQ